MRKNKKLCFLFGIVIALYIVSPCYGEPAPAKGVGSGERETTYKEAGTAGRKRQGASFCEELRIVWVDLLRKLRRDVSPHIEVEEKFDDNIFREKKDGSADVITRITPGIKYEFNPKIEKSKTRANAVVDLEAEIYRYAEHRNLNSENYGLLFCDINVETSFDRFTAYYNGQRAHNIACTLYPEAGTTPSARDRQVISWTNRYGVGYEIGAGRYKWPLNYDHKDTTYLSREDVGNNFSRDTFSVAEYIQILTETYLFFKEAYSIVKRPKRVKADTTYLRSTAGLDGEFAPKTRGTVSGGYTIVDPEVGKQSGYVDADVKLAWMPNPHFTFHVRATYTVQDTSEQVDVIGQTNEWGFGSPEGTTDINEQQQKVARLALTGEYSPPFDKKLLLRAGVSQSNVEYSDRDDRIFEVNLSARYRIREWMYFTGGYTFTSRTSSKDILGYDNNVFRLFLTAEF